jgi:phosphopantothenoylcysteine decarboxylase / phosphopantothenate---cysteine ligase
MKNKEKTNILIGITSSIAVYKILELISLLKKKGGYNITITMSENASKFVSPITFTTVTGNKTYINLWDNDDFIPHITLSDKADIFLIAPATYNIIGKIACGIADDLISTIASAIHTRKIIAPAMNVHMYQNPILKQNLIKLQKMDWEIIPPNEGMLACNYKGKGKLATSEEIIRHIEYKKQDEQKPLSGKKILITAGGTIEPIDPVRYLTNRSSGKMGISIARKAVEMGGDVTLIYANVSIGLPDDTTNIKALSAVEMREAVLKYYNDCDVIIMAGAVADYRVKNVSKSKIKKDSGSLSLELELNPDILGELSNLKRDGKIIIGFAAETEDLDKNAMDKLKRKKLDMIVANDVSGDESGFETDFNKVKIFNKNGIAEDLPLMSKIQVSERILYKLSQMLNKGDLS